MITKEFPNINGRMKNRSGSKSPGYIASLGMPVERLTIPLAYGLAMDVENTKKFLGSTIGVYAENSRYLDHKVRDVANHEFLDTMVKQFMKNDKVHGEGWVYGVVLSKENTDTVEHILTNQADMEKFLEQNGAEYNPVRVLRTLFVPSPKFTRQNWGFDYNIKDLHVIKDFQR